MMISWEILGRIVRARVAFVAVIALLVVAACGETGLDLAERRARRAERGVGEIVIGAAGPWSDQTWLAREGLLLAAEEINAAGGVMGRKIRLVLEDDKSQLTPGMDIAQKFVNDPEMVAVVAHENADIFMATSPLYEYSGLVAITPAVTLPKLTEQGFRLIFRNIPDDAEIARQLAEHARGRGLKRFVVYYAKDAYGRGLANSFVAAAENLGIAIVARRGFTATSALDFRPAVEAFLERDFDAIFLAGEMPHVAEFILHARRRGIAAPIYGGDGLDAADPLTLIGDDPHRLVISTYFDPDEPRPEVTGFVRAFRAQHGKDPDVWAALYYDALKLLAQAMTRAGSATPARVAEALRGDGEWISISGMKGFRENGDQFGDEINFKIVEGGRESIESLRSAPGAEIAPPPA